MVTATSRRCVVSFGQAQKHAVDQEFTKLETLWRARWVVVPRDDRPEYVTINRLISTLVRQIHAIQFAPMIPIVPAFGFESPWFLAGLLLAAIPVILHVFFRRPHREVPWGATRFLLSATKKHAPRIRLEQLILMALRVVILVLVVLALARPRTGDNGQAAAPTGTNPGGRRIILVLDASYSMAHEVDGVRRFDRARAALKGVLKEARAGDSFQLVRMSSVGERIVVAEPSFQAELIAEALDEQTISAGRAAPAALLREVAALLQKDQSPRPVEVVIASDFQRVDWRGEGISQDEIRGLVRQITEHARISLADASLTPHANQVVTRFEFEGDLPRTTRPARFTGTIVGHDLPGPIDTRFDLLVDGLPTVAESVAIAPDQPATIAFHDTLASAGRHGLELRLPADSLPMDNSRYLVVEAAAQLKVLLVEGAPHRESEQQSTYFLAQALAPGRSASAKGVSAFGPTVVADSELAAARLGEYDAVILANVERFTEREIERLRSFARRGGGVVICMGDQTTPATYNRLVAGKQGLLPVTFERVVGLPEDPEQAIPLSSAQLDHPISRPFAGNPGTGLESDFVLAYMRTTFDSAERVRVALQFASGDPAILTAPLGEGRVVLLTTSAGLSWGGPWPQIGRSYLPLVHEMTRFAATAQRGGRQTRLGEALVWTLPDRLAGLTATVTGPKQKSATLPMTLTPTGSEVRFEGTAEPGIYQIAVGPPVNQSNLYAVNVDPREGNLASLSTELRRALLPGAQPLAAGLSNAAGPGASSSNLWPISRWLLALALLALCAEQVMAWRFQRGLGLLILLGGIFAAYGLWRLDALAASVALTAATIVLLGAWWARQRRPILASRFAPDEGTFPSIRRIIDRFRRPWRR